MIYTRVYASDAQDVARLLAPLRRVSEYPTALYAARREWFVEQVQALTHPIEARLAAIDAALGEEYDQEVVNNLIEEKSELIQMERN